MRLWSLSARMFFVFFKTSSPVANSDRKTEVISRAEEMYSMGVLIKAIEDFELDVDFTSF